LLTEELMRSKLAAIEQKYDEFDQGLLLKPRKSVSALEFLKSVIPAKCDEIATILRTVEFRMEVLTVAFGKLGQPGNALQILHAVNKIIDACTKLLDWELEVGSIDLPVMLRALPATLRGTTRAFIKELKRIPDELAKATQELAKATQDTGSTKRVVEIKLTFLAPPQLAKFRASLSEVVKLHGKQNQGVNSSSSV
jgi:hypothetical protein